MKNKWLKRLVPKLSSFIILIILISGVLLPCLPVFATSGSLVGTSTTASATGNPTQPKSFFANGRFWIFYDNGSNSGFRTSSDNGTTWTAFTSIGSGASGSYSCTYFDGTYISYLRCSLPKIYYRRGIPASTGNITWSAAEQLAISANVSTGTSSIAVDSSGHAYIAYQSTLAGNYPTITKNANTDGTWVTSAGYPLILSTIVNSATQEVMSLTSNKMYIIYTASAATKIFGRYYDGAVWGATENITNYNPRSSDAFSATTVGDTIELIYNRVTTYQLRSCTRNSSTGIWSEVLAVASGTSNWYPTVTANNGNLVVFYISATKHIFYVTRKSGVWSSPVDWIDESVDSFFNYFYINSSLLSYGNYITLSYTTKAASPYSVKFAYLYYTLPSCTSVSSSLISMTKDGVTSGTLSGNVTNVGSDATYKYWFQLGLTTSYNISTANTTDNLTGIKTASLPNNLTPGSTYHWRFVAQNTVGTSYGVDRTLTFTMPSVTSITASAISMTKDGVTSGNFRGNISAMNTATNTYVYAVYGLTVAYGNTTGNVTANASGNWSIPMPTNLTPGATYHYRIRVKNGTISNDSGDDRTLTFTMPTISTSAATNLEMDGTGTHATLKGNISNMGAASSVYTFFQWSYDTSYVNTVGGSISVATGNVSYTLAHFIPNQTVYYRMGTRNGAVFNYSIGKTFTLTGTSGGGSTSTNIANYQLLQLTMIIFMCMGVYAMLKCFAMKNYIMGIIIAGVLAYLIVTLVIGMNGSINSLL